MDATPPGQLETQISSSRPTPALRKFAAAENIMPVFDDFCQGRAFAVYGAAVWRQHTEDAGQITCYMGKLS